MAVGTVLSLLLLDLGLGLTAPPPPTWELGSDRVLVRARVPASTCWTCSVRLQPARPVPVIPEHVTGDGVISVELVEVVLPPGSSGDVELGAPLFTAS